MCKCYAHHHWMYLGYNGLAIALLYTTSTALNNIHLEPIPISEQLASRGNPTNLWPVVSSHSFVTLRPQLMRPQRHLTLKRAKTTDLCKSESLTIYRAVGGAHCLRIDNCRETIGVRSFPHILLAQWYSFVRTYVSPIALPTFPVMLRASHLLKA